ncbi:uncharacterized protein LOC110465261 [Mizuhopecten yessoensis]|uniref:Hemicentin-1 n=1 Tax=Mizuhopecten yessoensis TaxID=6573 RepID=A0A210PRZ6_MIZYE|nr:uncharacterized protein LOC110465261 [Mizuhopecten yessoensis]OWF39259.1 Hemicentin-1 [Mizuhopecten yessoensis]
MEVVRTFITFALLVACVRGAPDNRGTEFIFGFMENQGTSYNLELFVTTSRTTTVNVRLTSPRYTNPSIDESFTVIAGTVKQLTFSNNLRMTATGLDSKGLLLVADDEVVIYGVNKERYSCDAFLGLPTDVLGTEYYAITQYPPTRYTEILVVGVNDSTSVGFRLADHNDVSVTYNGVTYRKNDWLNLTIDRFDTFQIHTYGDLTGTYIVSDKIVSAFSGNKKTKIGTGNSQDHLVEHLTPVNTWGKRFALIPIATRTTGDYYKFVASESDTVVTVNALDGNTAKSETIDLATGGTFSQKHYSSNFYAYVTSNKPILVAQFVLSQVTESADPSMLIIPPIEQFASDYTFTTPEYSLGSYSNYFMFVLKETEKTGLRLDEQTLPSNTVYNSVPGTDLVGGYVSLSEGSHTIRHNSPISVFGGFLFGRAHAESYGFPTGMRLSPINMVCVPSQSVTGDGLDNDCDGLIDEEICTPDNNATDDDGDGFAEEDCANPTPIDGGWTAWEAWGSCTCVGQTSASGGTQKRMRTCTNPVPKYDGKQCPSVNQEDQQCTPNSDCSADGTWTLWASWTTCSTTCGGGSFSRTRTCTDPAPSGNGASCSGTGSDSESCNTQGCPVDGAWGSWTQFSACSNYCGPGNSNRTRTCASPAPQNGGLLCTGDDIESQTCTGTCQVDGNWAAWLQWGVCTKSCDGGIRSRSRTCTDPAPSSNGDICPGSTGEFDTCGTAQCPTVAAGVYQQLCPTNWFTCESGTMRCVQWSMMCDCSNDCDDGSDETVGYAGCDAALQATCPSSADSLRSLNLLTVMTAVVCLSKGATW